jgi:hypothetical protein
LHRRARRSGKRLGRQARIMANTRKTGVDVPRKIRLRIVVVSPPAGTRWAMQLGRTDLAPPIRADERAVVFETDVEVLPGSKAEPFRLRGPAVQGRPGDRFLYLNSGTYAGDRASTWSRRAKVPLSGLTAWFAEAAGRKSDLFECRFSGTAKDGGPACASINLPAPGWTAA